ncbi:MAG: DUF6250 domain-containing protein [Balneolaceae bacterium]
MNNTPIPIILIFLLISCTPSGENTPGAQTAPSNTVPEYDIEDGWELIYETDFSEPLDPENWKIEMEPEPNSSAGVIDGKLVLNTGAGVTVWLNKLLEGDLLITYRRTVVMEDGPNDRLSDLNQFWMATDPRNENLFTRDGSFASYDSLSMYYAGVGGNYNSTTRFRKYQGDGEKTLLFDFDTEEYLLRPNHEYEVQLRVEGDEASYWLDGALFFHYRDPEPLEWGYFGFRSTWSRHEIDELKVYGK